MARSETIAFEDGSVEYKLTYGTADAPIDGVGLYVGADGAYIYPYDPLPLVVGTPGGKLFADLPTPVLGAVETILDSDTAAWGDTIGGGGTHVVSAWYNGVNWTVRGA